MPLLTSMATLAGLGLVPMGDFVPLASVTVGSGGASSIEFTSIPGTYQHLQVRIIARTARALTSDLIDIKVNSDTGSNYAYHAISGDGGTYANAFTSQTVAYAQRATGATATSNVFGVTILDILDYASTTKYKTMRGIGGWENNGSGTIYVYSNLWMNSGTAISGLTLTSTVASAFAEYSTAALYGVRS